jgi:hypothetical protein
MNNERRNVWRIVALGGIIFIALLCTDQIWWKLLLEEIAVVIVTGGSIALYIMFRET